MLPGHNSLELEIASISKQLNKEAFCDFRRIKEFNGKGICFAQEHGLSSKDRSWAKADIPRTIPIAQYEHNSCSVGIGET